MCFPNQPQRCLASSERSFHSFHPSAWCGLVSLSIFLGFWGAWMTDGRFFFLVLRYEFSTTNFLLRFSHIPHILICLRCDGVSLSFSSINTYFPWDFLFDPALFNFQVFGNFPIIFLLVNCIDSMLVREYTSKDFNYFKCDAVWFTLKGMVHHTDGVSCCCRLQCPVNAD